MSVAEIRNLCKAYPAFQLDGIDFSLEPGRITGLIGRNGAGKTTMLKSMLGLVHTTAGNVSYFGKSFAGNENEIKQRIGYASGAVNYYPRKKIRDIAAVTRSFYPTWDESAYQEYLSMFELDENKTPSELSEGMKVKFNLLLALSHRAEVLFLDEPTSGLDPFSRDELLELFIRLKERGVAILFSTHITSDLEKSADDIAYIQNGKMVASCPKDSFIAQYGKSGESLEDIVLRMEREVRA